MALIPILGLIIGLILGTISTFAVPAVYTKYLSIAVLAALDSILGGVRALLNGNFDRPILLTGFFTNAILAAGLAYLGDRLGVDLYLAAVFAFGIRLFNNLGGIRRAFLYNHRMKKAEKLRRKGAMRDAAALEASLKASAGTEKESPLPSHGPEMPLVAPPQAKTRKREERYRRSKTQKERREQREAREANDAKERQAQKDPLHITVIDFPDGETKKEPGNEK